MMPEIAMIGAISLMVMELGQEPGNSGALRYTIVGTGQTKCYDIRREVAPPGPGQPFFGQDAQYQGRQPAYRDNGDGSISDLNTGLTWMKTPARRSRGKRLLRARRSAGLAATPIGGCRRLRNCIR